MLLFNIDTHLPNEILYWSVTLSQQSSILLAGSWSVSVYWIRIRIQETIWIWIQSRSGSNPDPDPKHWFPHTEPVQGSMKNDKNLTKRILQTNLNSITSKPTLHIGLIDKNVFFTYNLMPLCGTFKSSVTEQMFDFSTRCLHKSLIKKHLLGTLPYLTTISLEGAYLYTTYLSGKFYKNYEWSRYPTYKKKWISRYVILKSVTNSLH